MKVGAAAELLSASGLVVMRALGLASSFLIALFVTRHLGPEFGGAFQFGLAALTMAGTAGRLGQDQLLLRTGAERLAAGTEAAMGTELARALTLTFLPLAAATLVAILAGQRLAAAPDERALITVMALASAPIGLLWVVTEALRGLQQVTAAIFWQGVAAPCAILSVFAAAWSAGAATPSVLGWGVALAYLAALGGAFVSWRLAIRRPAPGTGPGQWRIPSLGVLGAYLRKGSVFWVLGCLASLAGWIDVVLVYLVGTSEEAGIFAAVVRTGSLIAIAINLLCAAAVPKLAFHFARRDGPAFAGMFRLYLAAIAAFAVASGGVLLAFPGPVLALWGAEVGAYTQLLQIYVLFQIFQAFLILAALVAPAIGLEMRLLQIQAVNLVLKAIGIPALYAAFSLTGVVVAVGIAMAATSVLTLLVFAARAGLLKLTPLDLVLARRGAHGP
jgi:O-antigen/teichoic acid export membrane protein